MATSSNPLSLRPLVSAALFAATAALGGSALGYAASAPAAPDDGTWDIEAYDDCMSKTVRNPDLCCLDSGGVPTDDPTDTQADGSPNCYAPAAEVHGAEQQGIPPRLAPGAVIGDLSIVSHAPVGPNTPGLVPPGPMPTLIAPGSAG